MRQCRRHLPHRAHARDVQQAVLQFVQPPLGLLPLGQVADEAGEQARAGPICLADRQLHREGAAVLAPPDDDAADADDAPLAGAAVAVEIAVVLFPVGLRHQHPDVLAADLVCRVAEQAFRGRAEELDGAALVDHDHRVGHGLEDRAQQRQFAGGQVAIGPGRPAAAWQQRTLQMPNSEQVFPLRRRCRTQSRACSMKSSSASSSSGFSITLATSSSLRQPDQIGRRRAGDQRDRQGHTLGAQVGHQLQSGLVGHVLVHHEARRVRRSGPRAGTARRSRRWRPRSRRSPAGTGANRAPHRHRRPPRRGGGDPFCIACAPACPGPTCRVSMAALSPIPSGAP